MPLVVKSHHPWRIRIVIGLVAAALLFVGWSLFEYGRFSAGYDSVEATHEHKVLLGHVDDLEHQIESLREEKAVLERAAQIERKAYDELDTTLKVLQAEILELKQELAFYRGIVSPRDAAHGLHLQRFKIESNGKPGGYRYKVILTQVLKNNETARGVVRIKIEGIRDGKPSELTLAQVSEKGVKELDYRFKYFQNMEGDIQLPGDFKPQRVTISVNPRNRRNQEPLEKTFDWPA